MKDTIKSPQRTLNSFDTAYDKVFTNPLFHKEDWEYAAKHGTLGAYVNALNSLATADAKAIGDKYNLVNATSKTRMAALFNEAGGDRTNAQTKRVRELYDAAGAPILNEEGRQKTEEYFASDYEYNLELIRKQNDYNQKAYEFKLADDMKKEISGWSKFVSNVMTPITSVYSGAMQGIDNLTALAGGVVDMISGKVKEDKPLAEGFVESVGSNDNRFFSPVVSQLVDFERRYSDIRNIDGSYTNWGKYVGSLFTSVGEMLPSWALGAGAGSILGAAGVKAAGTIGSVVSQSSFYMGMTAGNIQETYRSFVDAGATPDAGWLLANAAIKSTLQWGIEYGLGRALGVTNLDSMVYGKAAGSIGAGSLKKRAIKTLFKEAGQEGLEEVLQDTSDFFVDKAFAKYLDKHYAGEPISWQSLMDAFIIGAIMSIGGSGLRILKTHGFTEGDVKYGKLEAWQYGIDTRSFVENTEAAFKVASKALKNKDGTYNDSQRKAASRAATSAYAAFRSLTSIYEEFGEERFAKANEILQEITDDIKAGDFDAGSTIIYLNYMQLQLGALKDSKRKAIEEALKNGKATEIVETVDKEDDGETINERPETEAAKKILEATGADKVTVTNGNVATIVEDENGETTVIVSENKLNNVNSSTGDIQIEIAVNRLVNEIATNFVDDKMYADITEQYKVYSCRDDVTSQEVADALLFDDNFFRAIATTGNKDVYKLLSALTAIEKTVVRGKARDAVYKERINKAIKNWVAVLTQYCIDYPEADPEMFLYALSDKKEADNIRKFILRERADYEIKNAYLLDRPFTADMLESLKAFNEKIDRLFTADEAKIIRERLDSPNPAIRQSAIRSIDNRAGDIYNAKYDGVTYMPETTMPNKLFNLFLKSNGLTLQTLHDLDSLTDADKAFIMSEYGEVTEKSMVLFRNAQFKKFTNSKMYYSVKKDGAIVILDDNEFVGFNAGKPAAYAQQFVNRDNIVPIAVAKRNNKLRPLLNDKVSNVLADTLTIDDVITNPDFLSDEVKADINRFMWKTYKKKPRVITPQMTFLYLQNYFIETYKTLGVVMMRDGSFGFAEMAPMYDVFKKDGDIEINENTKIEDVFKSKYIPEGLTLEITQNGKDPYYSLVAYSMIGGQEVSITHPRIRIPKSWLTGERRKLLKFVLAHEFHHAMQAYTHMNRGFTAYWLDFVKNKSAVIADIRKHVPQLFEDVEKNSAEEEQIASLYGYHSTGESFAYGKAGTKYMDYYPVQSKSLPNGGRALVFPWGAEVQLTDKSTNETYDGSALEDVEDETRVSYISDDADVDEFHDDLSGKALDEAYDMAQAAGDIEAEERLVKQAAVNAGYNSPKLYHGTDKFGFTKLDINEQDDQTSFFVTDDIEIAGSYSLSGPEVKQLRNSKRFYEDENEFNEYAERAKKDGESLLRDFDELFESLHDLRNFEEGGRHYKYYRNIIKSTMDSLDPRRLSLGFFRDRYIQLFRMLVAIKHEQEYEEFDIDLNPQNAFSEILSYYNESDPRFTDLAEKFQLYMDFLRDNFLKFSYEPGVYQFYANLNNMYVLDAEESEWNELDLSKTSNQRNREEIAERLKAMTSRDTSSDPELNDKIIVTKAFLDSHYPELATKFDTRRLGLVAKDAGYDGVIIKNVHDAGWHGRYDIPTGNVYLFFDPQRQLKSADLEVFNSYGEMVPLSKRFNPEHPDIRSDDFKLFDDIAQDDKYFEAAENNDEESMSKIIRQMAIEHGYDSPVLYHGTTNFGFTEISTKKAADGTSFFATDSAELASTYSGVSGVRKLTDIIVNSEYAEYKNSYDTILNDIKTSFNELFANDSATAKKYIDKIDGILNNLTDRDSNSDIEYAIDKLYWLKQDAMSESFDSKRNNDISKNLGKLRNVIKKLLKTPKTPGNYGLYGQTKNMLVIDAENHNWNKIKKSSIPDKKVRDKFTDSYVNTRLLGSYAKEAGYAGVTIKNVFDNGPYRNANNKPATVYLYNNPQAQLKSADAAVYNSRGDIVPPSRRFNSNHPDLRSDDFSLDSSYFEAIKDDDTETMDKIVKQAAAEHGYDSPKLYHGSDKFGWTKLDIDKQDDKTSFFVTDDLGIAGSYAYSGAKVRQLKDSDVNNSDNINKFMKVWQGDGKVILEDIKRLRQKLGDVKDDYVSELGYADLYEGVSSLVNYLYTNSPNLKNVQSAVNTMRDRLNLLFEYLVFVKHGHPEHIPSVPNDFNAVLSMMSEKDSEYIDFARKCYEYIDSLQKLIPDVRNNTGVYQFYGNLNNLFTLNAMNAQWDSIPVIEVVKAFGMKTLIGYRDELIQEREKLLNEYKAAHPDAGTATWFMSHLKNKHLAEITRKIDNINDTIKLNNGTLPPKARYPYYTTREIGAIAKWAGYDGVVLKNTRDIGRYKIHEDSGKTIWPSGSIYLFFDPARQLKSADTIVYNSKGEVVPPSRRFNPEHPDIRSDDFMLKTPSRKYDEDGTPLPNKSEITEEEAAKRGFKTAAEKPNKSYDVRYVAINPDGTQKLTYGENPQPIYHYLKKKQRQESRYVSIKKYKGTPLEAFLPKRKQLSTKLKEFVLNSNGNYDLAIQEKIDLGTLTEKDIYDFVRERTNISPDTFQAINDVFFQNEHIHSLEELDEKILSTMTRAWALYAIFNNKNLKDNPIIKANKDKLNDPSVTVEMLEDILAADSDLYKLYANKQGSFYDLGSSNINDFNIGYARIRYMRSYDGTIESERNAANMARVAAIMRYDEPTSNGAVATQEAGEQQRLKERAALELLESVEYDRNEITNQLANAAYIDAGKKAIADGASLNESIFIAERAQAETAEKLWAMSEKEFKKYIKTKNDVGNKIIEGLVLETTGEYAKLPGEYKVDMTPAHMMNRIRGAINTIKRNLTPKDLKKLAKANPDLFEADGDLRRDVYSNEVANKTRKGYHYSLKSAEELNSLFERINEIKRTVKDEVRQTKKQAKDYERIKRETKRVKETIEPKKESKGKKSTRFTIDNEVITIHSSKPIPNAIKQFLETEFTRSAPTRVKNLSAEDERHIKMYSKNFYEGNAKQLENLTTEDVLAIVDFYKNSGVPIEDINASYLAVELWTLVYIVQATKQGTANFVIDAGTLLAVETITKDLASLFGTGLATWRTALHKLDPVKQVQESLLHLAGLEVEDESIDKLLKALQTGDPTKVNEAKVEFEKRILELQAKKDASRPTMNKVLDNILAWERLAMLSGPGTWVRNKASNMTIGGVNHLSDKMNGHLNNVLLRMFQPINKKVLDNWAKDVHGKLSSIEGVSLTVDMVRNYLDAHTAKDEIALDNAKMMINRKILDPILRGRVYSILNSSPVPKGYISAGNNFEHQYVIAGTKVDNSVKTAIDIILDKSGLLDDALAALNKYDPRTKRSNDSVTSTTVLTELLANSIAWRVNSNKLFKGDPDVPGKLTNKVIKKGIETGKKSTITAGKIMKKASKETRRTLKGAENFIRKAISDDPSVRKWTLIYLGKMITEDIQNGVITDINEFLNTKKISVEFMNYVAEAFKLASNDFMHKPNLLYDFESWLAKKSYPAYFAYKQLFPFAGASWNWFVEGLKYSPAGLGNAILRFAKLENTIAKMDENRRTFKHNDTGVSSSFAKYMALKDINKGIIGTVGWIAGALLAAFGIARIDKDDEKYKLYVGSEEAGIAIDISGIFGTQGILLGMATAGAFDDAYEFGDVFVATLNQLSTDFIGTDLFNSMRYYKEPSDWLLNQPYQIASMAIPNFLKTYTAMYTPGFLPGAQMGRRRYDNDFLGKVQRLCEQSIPLLKLFNPATRIDPFTGENQTTCKYWWLDSILQDINKLTPINVKPYRVSDMERLEIMYGYNKIELTGRYLINGVKTKLDAKQTAELNRKYAELNVKAFKILESNVGTHKVEQADGTYKDKRWNQMSGKEKAAVVNRSMVRNSDYAKIYVLTSSGQYKYYANDKEFANLRTLGITKNVYRSTNKIKGFVKSN